MSSDPIQIASPNETAALTPPTGGERNFAGWLILAILFAVLIAGELGASFTNATQAKMDEFDSQLKLIVQEEQSEAKPSLGSPGPKEELSKLESQFASQKKLDDLGNELYAAVLTEEKKPVPVSVYQPLLSSKSDSAKSIGRIYAPGKLSLDDARSLQKRLSGEKDFVVRLAIVQALEKAGDRTARAKMLPKPSPILEGIATLGLMGLMGASVFVWFGYFAARSSGDLRPAGLRNGALTLPQADQFAIRAAQLFCGWIVIGLLCLELFGKARVDQPPALFAQGFAMLAFVPLLFRIPLGQTRLSLADLGLTRENLGRNVLWGLAGFAAEIPVAVVLSLLMMALFRFLPTPQHPAEEELRQTTSPVTIAAILFVGTVVAAFWEEILFRGLLFPALSRLCKSIPLGALISSIVFASIHPQGAAVWPSLCVVGLMSCALSYQTRSLVPSIVMHFCHNAVLLALTVQTSSG